jgi:hypothetical protein
MTGDVPYVYEGRLEGWEPDDEHILEQVTWNKDGYHLSRRTPCEEDLVGPYIEPPRVDPDWLPHSDRDPNDMKIKDFNFTL